MVIDPSPRRQTYFVASRLVAGRTPYQRALSVQPWRVYETDVFVCRKSASSGPHVSSRSYGVVVVMAAASRLRPWLLGALMTSQVLWVLVATHQSASNSNGSVTGDLEVVTVGPLWNWHPSRYPDPKTEPEACGRPSSSSVCDPDGWLTKQEGRYKVIVISML